MRIRFLPELFTPDDTLHVVGSAKDASFDNTIRLMVWNIYKGRNKSWQNDFLHLTQDRNLVFLQESVMNTHHDTLFQSPERIEWVMARSYQSGRTKAVTGVKTGSSVHSAGKSFFVSPDVEPFMRTPKMLLATTYPVAGSEYPLLAVNVHAINFVSLQKFNRQIGQIAEAIENHKGPVILAGDFNTWNRMRYKNLREAIDKMELIEAPLPRKIRWAHLRQPLDYVFYRGLTLQNADVLFNIRTSDHYPILADFTIA